MDDPNPTKRHWFRFSLRTLFVLVTVFCTWLGYQLNWIRQRHAELEYRQGTAEGAYFYPPPAPLSLRLFGESGAEVVPVYEDEPESEFRRMKKLFPEAHVVRDR